MLENFIFFHLKTNVLSKKEYDIALLVQGSAYGM